MAIKCMFLTSVALVLVASFVAANEAGLRQLLKVYHERRELMIPQEMALAEEWARQVGAGRMYLYTLKMYPGAYNERASLENLQKYIGEFGDKLKTVSDADATINFFRTIDTGASGQLNEEQDFANQEAATELISNVLVPACEGYVMGMMKVYDAAAMANQAQLSKEIYDNGLEQDVREFILNWAHYHTCRLLVFGNRSELINKIPKRADDERRLKAMRQAKLAKQN